MLPLYCMKKKIFLNIKCRNNLGTHHFQQSEDVHSFKIYIMLFIYIILIIFIFIKLELCIF
jgi:hypothetical protein